LAEFVIAVATHEMPVLCEVMIQPNHPVVVTLRQPDRIPVTNCVEGITNGRGRSKIVCYWHELRPNLVHDGIETDAAWVARLIASRAAYVRRLVSDAAHGNRIGVQVERHPGIRSVADA